MDRGDIGEREFLIGQVAYEAGEEIEAKKFLKIANEKSEGMYFKGVDPKYRRLIE